MQISVEPQDRRVLVRLENDAEEASFAYDLVQSGRLLVESKESLPLPFRGQFLFKLPERSRPVELTVGRFEASAADSLAGKGGLRIYVSVAPGQEVLLAELEAALQSLPPASAEEFKSDTSDRLDEWARIRKMTFAQKVIYATRAGQSGRAILMQQPSPLLMLYLAKNPLITLPEVIQIAKLPSIDALVAEYLVKLMRSNPQWAMSEELKLAIAANSKTPGGTALSLLGHISSRNLRQLTKHGDLRSTLRQAALKLLTERKD